MLEYLTGLGSVGYFGVNGIKGAPKAELPLIAKSITTPFIKKLHGLNKHDINFIRLTERQGGSIILLLRNPIETFIRHFKITSVDQLFYCLARGDCNMFFSNLKAYDQVAGKKKMIFYEQMINDPRAYLSELSDFFDLPKSNLINSFIDNFNTHKKKSLNAYSELGESITKGASVSFHTDKVFHNQKSSGITINEINDLIFQMANGIGLSKHTLDLFSNAYGEVHEK
jgi:hypothetical protein